ncbi:MAG: ParB/RepB/Spo0J family partition protein [Holosporaceae bacterium]|jgi:ParB family chromosome partitioning protein|nr:ParB/RepB/Spo0J family partition protein [Holosporaceae bacterium]
MTNKSLGRGLSAFLDLELDATNSENNEIVKIKVDEIKENPFQPRKTFDEEGLNSLAESIKRKGVLQPILARKLGDGEYQLIAGERRLRASKVAGMTEIPAIIVEMSKEDQLEVAILENIQREDLNPLEEAEAYKRLVDEFGRTQEELSEILGKSRSHIANILRLLTLPDEVKDMIRAGKLAFGHARALVGAEDAVSLAKEATDQSMNVRQVEELVKRRKNGAEKKNAASYVDPEIANLANQISSLVGLKSNVKLKGTSGVIEISFSNLEELDAFVRRLNV